MTRPLFLSTMAAAICTAGAAFAADWTVAPAGGVCEARARLVGASSDMSLVVHTAGETTRLAVPAGAPAESVSVAVDGQRQPLSFRTADGKLEADLSPQVIGAIARGGRLSVRGLAPQPLRASLRGSQRAMGDLQRCGEQVRLAALSQRDAQAQAEAQAAAAAKAQADAQAKAQAEAAATAEAKKAADEDLVRQSREVLPGMNLK